ncbi:helix-turn-helix transcriptional regulator [Pediococcus pentosaceus]|uniref:helix-turn-helix domain-containing protein n=1 Tax=Pediococcus pentosaceus TaxID=1255 RepID=UPI002F2EB666
MWLKINKILKQKNMSVHYLAKEINEPYTTIMNIKNGATKNPGFNLVVKIADELGVPLDYFREG